MLTEFIKFLFCSNDFLLHNAMHRCTHMLIISWNLEGVGGVLQCASGVCVCVDWREVVGWKQLFLLRVLLGSYWPLISSVDPVKTRAFRKNMQLLHNNPELCWFVRIVQDSWIPLCQGSDVTSLPVVEFLFSYLPLSFPPFPVYFLHLFSYLSFLDLLCIFFSF